MTSSIEELMAADPLGLTKEDVTRIVEHFRASRAAFMTTEKTVQPKTKPKKVKPVNPVVGQLNLDIKL